MIAIVIPVRNERESIPPMFARFLTAAPSFGPYRIFVVDGVSTDGTPDLVETYADRLELEVVRLRENLGLGGALEVGLERALAAGAEVVVTMDGDDSHDPATIPALLARIRDGHDVVIASRFEPGGEEVGVAGYRKVLSHVASGALRALFPVGTAKDYSSGFRAYRAPILERVRQRYGRLVSERGFSCMMELLLKLRVLGAVTSEVPLVLRYDLKRSPSKMNIGHTIVRYLIVIGQNLRFVRGRVRTAAAA